MTLRIGYFENFKGGNVVLLCGDRGDVTILRSKIMLALTEHAPLAVHEVALVAKLHPARLFVASPVAKWSAAAGDWLWRLTGPEHEGVDSKLEVLEQQDGHQYFDLEPAGAQLIVSVGERISVRRERRRTIVGRGRLADISGIR